MFSAKNEEVNKKLVGAEHENDTVPDKLAYPGDDDAYDI